MRALKYSINITLDGCVDHFAVKPDHEMHSRAAQSIAKAGALLFGRITYSMMEEAWRPVAETGERPDWMPDWMEAFARTISPKKKFVVSDTLDSVDWNAERIAVRSLEERVRQLKSEAGDYLYTGGVMLPQALAELGLIDEYEFLVHPRIVGNGRKLFTGLSKPLDLKLVRKEELGSGAVGMTYVPKT